MRVIRRGSKGMTVRSWETFLTGRGNFKSEIDGTFGDDTHASTVEFQKQNGLSPDGVVGPKTWACALELGYPGIDDDNLDETGPNWPPRPSGLNSINQAAREKLFGKFSYVSAPAPGNPEAILITDNWALTNIATVEIPQLRGIRGAPSSCRVPFNSKAAPQFKLLWQAWEDAGLLDQIVSFAGTWVPRFIRGSRTTLSNHAWGTAFDINAEQNPLGAVPSLVGRRGSTRKLVSLASEHGFFWGGWFPNRPDGMHFEVSTIL